MISSVGASIGSHKRFKYGNRDCGVDGEIKMFLPGFFNWIIWKIYMARLTVHF